MLGVCSGRGPEHRWPSPSPCWPGLGLTFSSDRGGHVPFSGAWASDLVFGPSAYCSVDLRLWSFLSPSEAAIRAKSFIWPGVEASVGFVVVAALIIVNRPRRRPGVVRASLHLEVARWSALALLACATASLFAAGVILWLLTPSSLVRTSNEVALKRDVGSSLVGFELPWPFIVFNANDVYQVQEFAVYDPMLPESFFRTWRLQTGRQAGMPSQFKFAPVVDTAKLARRFGVGFVIGPVGWPGPRRAASTSTRISVARC